MDRFQSSYCQLICAISSLSISSIQTDAVFSIFSISICLLIFWPFRPLSMGFIYFSDLRFPQITCLCVKFSHSTISLTIFALDFPTIHNQSPCLLMATCHAQHALSENYRLGYPFLFTYAESEPHLTDRPTQNTANRNQMCSMFALFNSEVDRQGPPCKQ